MTSTLAGASAIAFALVVGACGSSGSATSTLDGAATDATSTTDAADAADASTDAPLRPYPPGPYGGAIGDTMPDFTVLGYAMSPAQRDSTRLPFGPISLSQARSARDCGCMVILWNAAGYGCSWCGIEEETLGASVLEDPSMCVFEVVGFNFDVSGGTVAQPATRADLDQRTQTSQQPFPVGIATDSARSALSSTSICDVPVNFVVRPSDMKLIGFIDGVGSKIPDQARALCAAPHPGIETIATGLDPRHMTVDPNESYVTDGTHGFLAQDLAATPLAPPVVVDPRPANALTVDSDAVYYGVANGDGTFAIARYVKADGTHADIATFSSAVLAMTVDTATGATAQASLVFARADGVVGIMPKTGGAITTLASGESLAPTIALGPSYAFFVSANDIVRVARTTATREVVYPFYNEPSGHNVVPKELVLNKEGLLFTGVETVSPTSPLGGALYEIPGDAAAPPIGLAGTSVPMGVARDTDDAVLLAFRRDVMAALPPSGFVGRHQTGDGTFWVTATPGVPDARAVAGDGKTIYFTTDESAPGASDGTVQRVLR
jgi:hypothetical protein